MSEVFISYAREAESYARKVADALRAGGFSVWYDEDLPAHRAFSEVIEERLRSAKAVIAIWSAEAVKSEWVRAEADTARKARVLVQLRVDETEPPLPFNQLQCVDLKGWSGNQSAPGWRKIIASVEELTGRVNTPKPAAAPLARAPDSKVPKSGQTTSSQMQRRLAAILVADAVGHHAMMEADEIDALMRLKANRSAIFDPQVAAHGGRVFKLYSDVALVEFSSVVAAMKCALAIQEATEKAEQDPSSATGIRYRIGINLGEIIVDGDDINGDGVNVAAWVESVAPAGGIAVSRIVHDNAVGKLPCVFEDIGDQSFRGLKRPVQVFLVRAAGCQPT